MQIYVVIAYKTDSNQQGEQKECHPETKQTEVDTSISSEVRVLPAA